MSSPARAKRKPQRSLQDRIAELHARATVVKKRHDLKQTIAQAKQELKALGRKK